MKNWVTGLIREFLLSPTTKFDKFNNLLSVHMRLLKMRTVLCRPIETDSSYRGVDSCCITYMLVAKAISGSVKFVVALHGHANVEQVRAMRLSKTKKFVTQNKYDHRPNIT